MENYRSINLGAGYNETHEYKVKAYWIAQPEG